MNVGQYLSSGIIESYVLGLASEQESREVEQFCDQYPEIKEALISFQDTMSNYAQLHAVSPPAGLKEKIWSALLADQENKATLSMEEEEKKENPAPQVPGRPYFQISAISPFMKYLVAASLVLLLGSVVLNMVFFNKYQAYKNKFDALTQANNTVVAQNQVYETKMVELDQDMHLIHDPSIKPVVMEGVPGHTGMMATVYWNHQTRDLYLAVNQLPVPPPDKQYQLWAIIGGKPVDAGVFTLDNAGNVLQKMKAVGDHVQAFAITLEKKGGSPTPTLSAMYVLGKA
ncbi:MAG: anti-sigma factor [Chitinophagaceae bacterium]